MSNALPRPRLNSHLRARANTGDESAATQLAELLAQRADLGGLHTEVLVGNVAAARHLQKVLATQRPAAAERLRTHGLNPDGTIPD